ncbi:MAG: acetoacetate--CoA ligase, partial [Desulfobacteraceae bacterium]|nr:acetoacetate--CoA ligase [Desulfobacteraceae bacterium]
MAKLLWQPSDARIKSTNMYRFMTLVNERFKKNVTDYPALWDWSVNNLEDFWALTWDFIRIKASKKYDRVLDNPDKMPGAR